MNAKPTVLLASSVKWEWVSSIIYEVFHAAITKGMKSCAQAFLQQFAQDRDHLWKGASVLVQQISMGSMSTYEDRIRLTESNEE